MRGHLETVATSWLRKPQVPLRASISITTPDDDFLELNHYNQGSQSIVVINHGLEGNQERPYVLGAVNSLLSYGYDVITWNYRSCGNIMNAKPIFYHSGATYDQATVINYICIFLKYKQIGIMGFSLGGNLALKYAGETNLFNPAVKAVVGISVPFNLAASSKHLEKGFNKIYTEYFLKSLRHKVKRKWHEKGIDVGVSKLALCKTLYDFDHHFTGPLHGFDGANDYYRKNSCQYFFNNIQMPALLINAQNDPFLPFSTPESCYLQNKNLTIMNPKFGGHVGFWYGQKFSKAERLAGEFLNEHLPK